MVFFVEGFVGGFELGGLFLIAREVQLYEHKIFFRKILKCGLLKNSFGEFLAGRAPVGARELEEDRLFARGGLREGGGVIRAPDFGGMEADRGKKEAE